MKTLSAATLVRQPAAQLRSAVFAVWINDEHADAMHAGKADFCSFECAGPVEVRVVVKTGTAENAQVRPLRHGISPLTIGAEIRFRTDGARFLCVEVPGLKPLFLYANGSDADYPSPFAPGVHYYAAGRVYDAGEIVLKSGETLCIEAGAVVRGCVRARNADNITICGRGILDGGFYAYDAGHRTRSIVLDNCTNVRVSDIVMIEPSSWMLVLARCRGVRVEGLKQIGSCMSSDGIDICGSRDVVIEDCCLRNDDDNIAVKSGTFGRNEVWEGDVDNIVVRRCVFLNGQPGNVMEIGYELRAERVANIVFEDIDVLNGHGEGAVFSIHNGDRAVVENVRWENIRVEHYWDKLVDFRVVFARYNKDSSRGRIRNICLRNIRVIHDPVNAGCSISLISGISPDMPVQGVVFDDFRLNARKVMSLDDLDLHLRNAEGIRFL